MTSNTTNVIEFLPTGVMEYVLPLQGSWCAMPCSHYMGTGPGQVQGTGRKVFLIYCAEMFTQVRDREKNQNQLFALELVQFPVPVPVLFPCTVNKPLKLMSTKTEEAHYVYTCCYKICYAIVQGLTWELFFYFN